MAGRPKYEPSPADRETVRALAAAGIPQERIARCIGNYGITAKTMRKHFRRELDVTQDLMTAFTMGKLRSAIEKEEPWAVTLWLKCRAMWAEPQRIAHTGADGGAIDINLTSPGEIIASRIAQLAERTRPPGDTGESH